MNVRQMAILLDREAFVNSPDGLVPCVIRDVKVQYGTTRLQVEVTRLQVATGTYTKLPTLHSVDAERVYLQSAANAEVLVPAMEVWS